MQKTRFHRLTTGDHVSWRKRVAPLFAVRSAGLTIILVALWLITSLASPYFLTTRNILTVLLQSSTAAVLGIGMTFVIIQGGIDISVGSSVALTSMVVGILLTRTGVGFGVSCLGGLMVGFVIALINGWLISKFSLQPMVVTLGTMGIARGLTFVSTAGRPIFVRDATLLRIGGGKLGVVPIPVLVALACFVAGYLILHYTEFGRYVFAIGGNPEAARLSGVDVARVRITVYAICGLCASIVGILVTGLLAASEPTIGLGMELEAIAVVAIGGTAMSGGAGGLVGTMLGAVLIGTLKNSMNLLNVVSYYQQVLIGSIIVIAVLVDRVKK